ncbi:glycosyltransferase family 39 protein [Streptomyces sp. S07_1.15]|uniref:glycosyltransferase family 39 protein n=1 Tax=Streptomyces sp. S07_1.15 TaxID=2873925 RepID=UPI001D137109|nr:glycosyltransferase family 39 protein [Streptomyces sp. S07_1.15]MCC3653235.1 glycosyltransferase family 39 protein [Streptomyces sp. S07_1.15]
MNPRAFHRVPLSVTSPREDAVSRRTDASNAQPETAAGRTAGAAGSGRVLPEQRSAPAALPRPPAPGPGSPGPASPLPPGSDTTGTVATATATAVAATATTPRGPARSLRVRSAAVLAPAAVALLLGLWGIRRENSMWRDESVTYQVAHRELQDIWRLLSEVDAVHGLYYLLMKAVFTVWDGGLVALRLPSVLATALAAAGVAAIALRLAGARAAVFSGTVFAVVPMVQHYAQEGRSYALVCAAVTWACYLLLRGVEGGGARIWTAYAGVLLVACWLHEFAILVLAAHGVTLLRSAAGPATRRAWLTASGRVGAGVLPLALVSAGQAERQLGWLGRPELGAWLLFFAVSAAGWACARALPVLPEVRQGQPEQREGGRRREQPGRPGQPERPELPDRTSPPPGPAVGAAALALPLLVVPAGLLMTVSLVKPWYVDRYVLYGMTGLALLLGICLARVTEPVLLRRLLPRRPARIAAVCGCAAGLLAVLLPWSLLVRSPESRKDDVVAVADAVREVAAPGDAVLFMPSRRREWLLSFPEVRAGVKDLALRQGPAASATLQGTELPADEIRRRVLAADRVIAVTDPEGQPLDAFRGEAVKRETLDARFSRCEPVRVHGAQVVVHVRSGSCEAPD